MNLSDLKSVGHWPTLVTAFLYFDYSFMVWTLLGAPLLERNPLRFYKIGFFVCSD